MNEETANGRKRRFPLHRQSLGSYTVSQMERFNLKDTFFFLTSYCTWQVSDLHLFISQLLLNGEKLIALSLLNFLLLGIIKVTFPSGREEENKQLSTIFIGKPLWAVRCLPRSHFFSVSLSQEYIFSR